MKRKKNKDDDTEEDDESDASEDDADDADNKKKPQKRRAVAANKKKDKKKSSTVATDIYEEHRQCKLIELVYDPAVQQGGQLGKRLHKNVIEIIDGKEQDKSTAAELSKVTSNWFREAKQISQSAKNLMFFAPLNPEELANFQKTCPPALFQYRKDIAGKLFREVVPDNISMYRAEEYTTIEQWLITMSSSIFGAANGHLFVRSVRKMIYLVT